jgi:hypothetical protein
VQAHACPSLHDERRRARARLGPWGTHRGA